MKRCEHSKCSEACYYKAVGGLQTTAMFAQIRFHSKTAPSNPKQINLCGLRLYRDVSVLENPFSPSVSCEKIVEPGNRERTEKRGETRERTPLRQHSKYFPSRAAYLSLQLSECLEQATSTPKCPAGIFKFMKLDCKGRAY